MRKRKLLFIYTKNIKKGKCKMKIKEKLKASGKKLLAGVMAVATAITALPLQSLAAEIKPIAEPAINLMSLSTGSTGYTLYGKDYNPSDGNAWGGSDVSNPEFWYAYYDTDGTRHVEKHVGTSDASMLLMATSPNAKQGEYAICLEAGKDFEDGIVYTSKSINMATWTEKQKEAIKKKYSMENSDQYIALAMYYGLQGTSQSFRDKTLPGSNADDWVIATQVLVWELQQGIRRSLDGGAYGFAPGELVDVNLGSGKTLSASTFQMRLGGSATTNRSKAYNWILEHVRAESKAPSFNGGSYKMTKKSDGTYSVTITDSDATNGIYHEFQCSNSNISISRSGNRYTITSSKALTGAVTITAKNENNDMRIYEAKDTIHQTVANGRTNPMAWSFTVTTEGTGSCKIIKEWDHKGDAKADKDDVYFVIAKGSSIDGTKVKATGSAGSYTYSGTATTGTNFKLNSSGNLTVSNLPAGTYTVQERGYGNNNAIPNYTRSTVTQTVTIAAGESKSVTFKNTRNHDDADIYKTFDGKQGTDAQNEACEFTVKNSSGKFVNATKNPASAGLYLYSTMSGTSTTYKLGKDASTGKWRFKISGLPTGTYTVTETKHPDGYTPESTSKTITVTKGGNNSVTFNNTQDKGGLKIVKKWIPSDGGSSTSIVISAPALVISKS